MTILPTLCDCGDDYHERGSSVCRMEDKTVKTTTYDVTITRRTLARATIRVEATSEEEAGEAALSASYGHSEWDEADTNDSDLDVDSVDVIEPEDVDDDPTPGNAGDCVRSIATDRGFTIKPAFRPIPACPACNGDGLATGNPDRGACRVCGPSKN